MGTVTNQEVRYGSWRIYLDPPPIPIRTHDWTFVHDAYDGPGGRRVLSGTAPSLEEAKTEIDGLQKMWPEDY